MSPAVRFWSVSAIAMALILLVVAWGLGQWHLAVFTRFVGDRLVLLNELRRGAVEQYFATAEAELMFWSTSPEILQVQSRLQEIWNGGEGVATQARSNYVDNNPHPEGAFRSLEDAGDGSDFSALHREVHPRARLFVTERGYYDFFLIGPEGDVFYTVEKEADFATNLVRGQWSDSGLAEVFRRARAGARERLVAVSDMEPYGPSGEAPAVFMGTAIHGNQGEFLGVIVFQLPTDRIVSIMNYTSGMGETGETYLVGQDLLMRSDSRFSEASTILGQQVDTPTVRRALAGKSGLDDVVDYREIAVMSAYSPLAVGDTTWAVMAEIDREEVVRVAAANRPAVEGFLLFFYALSLWSLWYWRNRQLPEANVDVAALDFPEGDGGGMGA